jgi:hypothetical protein
MTTISTELGFLIFIMSFFGIYTFIVLLPNFPNQMKLITPLSSSVLLVGFPAVAGACTIFTGLACGVGMVVFVAIEGYLAYISPNSLFSLLIIIPSTVGLVYIISKLARGGG